MKRIHIGIILTYTALIVNTFSGFLLMPFMLRSMGELEYSIYQLVISFSGYLMLVNMGTGAAMNRFLSMYRVKGDKQGEANYILLNLMITFCLMVIVIGAGFYLRGKLGGWFPNIINTDELENLAKTLCLIVTFNVALNFLNGAMEGILMAYGRIDLSQCYSVIKLIVRMAAIFLLLKAGCSAVGVTLVDTGLLIGYFLFLSNVLKHKCGLRLRITRVRLDVHLLRETAAFSIASLLGGLSGQLNNNIDKSILAVLCGGFEISVYSFATNFYTIFTSVGTCLNNVYLNKITELTYRDSSLQKQPGDVQPENCMSPQKQPGKMQTGSCGDEKTEKLENLNIKIGRFQNLIVGMLFFGFICLGEDFVRLWMGERYLSIYKYALLLMIPNYFVCIGGVQSAILDARNKKIVKSGIIFVISLLNVMLTVFLVKLLGGIGAPLGTMLSLILGYNICLNVYIHQSVKLNVIRMYREVFRGFLPAQVLTSIIALLIFSFHPFASLRLWTGFLCKGVIFVVLYAVFIYRIALNKEEKQIITGRGK